MRIVYHLGAHCTDDERLLRCLLKNRATLAEQGIIVPGPARYRTLLRDTVLQLRGKPATREAQALLLDQIMAEDRAERLILSWDSFIGFAQGAVGGPGGAQFYPGAGDRVAALTQIFPEIEVEFHLAIRNPATFLPTLCARLAARNPEVVPAIPDPLALCWSDLAQRLRAAVPDAPLTVWCDEDTPLLWPEVLAAVSGHRPGTALGATTDLLASIMTAEGMQRMEAYLTSHPPTDAAQHRRIAAAFLARFALPDAIEQEVEMPGWDEPLVAQLSAAYDRDVARLARLPGITFLRP